MISLSVLEEELSREFHNDEEKYLLPFSRYKKLLETFVMNVRKIPMECERKLVIYEMLHCKWWAFFAAFAIKKDFFFNSNDG